MAFKEELEEALNSIENVEYRDQMRDLLTKPEMKSMAEGWLRQNDYSRKLNEVSAKHKEWQDWYEKEKPKVDHAYQENSELKRRLEEAQARRSKSSDDDFGLDDDDDNDGASVKPEDIDKIARERGYITEDVLRERLQSESQTFANNLGSAMFGVMDIMDEHQATFGERLDRNKLFEFMSANGIQDPRTAYKQMVSDKLIDKQVETRVKQKEEELRQKFMQNASSENFPGDDGPPIGHLQKQFLASQKPDPDNPPELGARAAAKALREEGKY